MNFARLFSDFVNIFAVEKLLLKLKFVTDFNNIIFDHFEVAVENLINPYCLHFYTDFIYFLFVWFSYLRKEATEKHTGIICFAGKCFIPDNFVQIGLS